ncbi:MAG: hypothetical protein Q4G16_10560 [Cruoricaptor ignavus]|nr:hypothetical protein [Cruoricaptor ignavus]
MQTIYKVFFAIFVVFIGLNFYAINWKIGVMHEDNTKFLFSISAGIIGAILVFILNFWSKLLPKR